MADKKTRLLVKLFLSLLFHFLCTTNAYNYEFPSAYPPDSWSNNASNKRGDLRFADGSSLRPILLLYDSNLNNPPLCLGFFSNVISPNVFYLVVMIVQDLTTPNMTDPSASRGFAIDEYSAWHILWSANRENPVREHATLEFTDEGDLVLKSEVGSPVWATQTSGRGVEKLEITEKGNLILYNNDIGIVWQSFDYPMDTWLPNQKIGFSQRLTSRISLYNLSQGSYYLSMARDGLGVNFSFHDSDNPLKLDVFRLSLQRLEFGDNDCGIDLFRDHAQLNCNGLPYGYYFVFLLPDGNLTLFQLQRINLSEFRIMKQMDVRKFLGAQNQKSKNPKKKGPLVPMLVSSLVGGIVISFTFVAALFYVYGMPRKEQDAEEQQDDQVIETLQKFTFEELKSCTKNFSVKLGKGGFGSVFEGILSSGRKVAVKCLEATGQGTKEFLAELNTIGKVDHFNLVKLIGYCTEKSNRLLVYEHMCNASLDKWIFNSEKAQKVNWKTRQKIIHGVAKGLHYLHEECRQNIIHFDIKPQNILLDRNFNPKISDFGLAKLIDRSQSLVLTALKGTPGYLAPELFGCVNISVKADIYSFGIVILETVSGRKNLDLSKPTTLIAMAKQRMSEGRLDDLIDQCSDEIRRHREEAIQMVKIALWCLQTHERRPSMSMVVKVLDGSTGPNLVSVPEFTITDEADQLLANRNASIPSGVSVDLSGPR